MTSEDSRDGGLPAGFPVPVFLIASFNRGKVGEFETFLSTLGVRICGLEVLPAIPPCREDGHSFEENARQKAEYYSKASSRVTLADDSGLVVDALNGEPGIYSARYVSDSATDQERYQDILCRMSHTPETERGARFTCIIALARHGLVKAVFEGEVEGRIAREPSGENGFGFDPIFYLPEIGKTMAQLTSAEKLAVSHRGRALQKLKAALTMTGFLESLS